MLNIGYHSLSNQYYTLALGDRFRPMSNNYTSQTHMRKRFCNRAFVPKVQVARSFVERKNSGLLVKRTRQQKALLLSATQACPKVSYHGVITHWHLMDIPVQLGQPCTLLDSGHVGLYIEETYIVGKTTAQQCILLHHGSNQLANIRQSNETNWNPAVEYLTFGWLQQSKQNLEQGSFTAA